MDAQLLAGMGLERDLRIGHHLPGDLRGELGGDTAALVDLHQLLELSFGATMDLLPLALELALEQFGLSAHRDVLTGSHRERTAEKPCQTREPHDSHWRARPRKSQDQRNVGHKAVTDTEHGGPRAASPDVAVVVLLDRALCPTSGLTPSLQDRGQPSGDTEGTRAALGGTPRGRHGEVG